MPGTYSTIFLAAFDLDARGQAIPAFSPRTSPSEIEAIETASRFAGMHAGAVVWKREANPVIGEEGDPVIIWQIGVVGDFD